jgi:hypothetical protein
MSVKSTRVSNLVLAENTDIYYARIRVLGKLKWRSLSTKIFTTAMLRLGDTEAEMRSGATKKNRTLEANISFEDARVPPGFRRDDDRRYAVAGSAANLSFEFGGMDSGPVHSGIWNVLLTRYLYK